MEPNYNNYYSRITREQIQDLRTYGIDVEAYLADELAKQINKEIVRKLFSLNSVIDAWWGEWSTKTVNI